MERDTTVTAAGNEVDLVATIGGTGLRRSDTAPEMTAAVLGRRLPGIMYTVMSAWLAQDLTAALERGIAGLVRRTLVINLPDVPDRVRTAVAALDPVIDHAIDQLHDVRNH